MEARRIVRPCLLAAALLVVPVAAHANAGTPLMWAEMFHLVFLNAVIGAIEAGLLRCFFGARGPTAFGWMVAANYASAAVGAASLVLSGSVLMTVLPGGAPLYKGPTALAVMAVASLALSVVLEWPFVAAALRPTRPGALHALKASCVAQVVSYSLLLAPLYWAASPITLYRDAYVVHGTGFADKPLATVYYLGPGGGTLWRVRTDGTGRALLRSGLPRGGDLRLSALEDGKPGRFCLWVGAVKPRRGEPLGRVALDNVGPFSPAIETAQAMAYDWEGNWFAFGRAVDLRPDDQRSLVDRSGFWPSEGLYIIRRRAEVYRLALDTPFAHWLWRNATVLPGDQVVAQLGWGDESQVVLLDLRTRRLGVIALGQSPVVVPADVTGPR